MSVECTNEAEKQSVTKQYQTIASLAIFIMVLASITCGIVTIYVQVYGVIKKKLAVKEDERKKTHKFDQLMLLAAEGAPLLRTPVAARAACWGCGGGKAGWVGRAKRCLRPLGGRRAAGSQRREMRGR